MLGWPDPVRRDRWHARSRGLRSSARSAPTMRSGRAPAWAVGRCGGEPTGSSAPRHDAGAWCHAHRIAAPTHAGDGEGGGRSSWRPYRAPASSLAPNPRSGRATPARVRCRGSTSTWRWPCRCRRSAPLSRNRSRLRSLQRAEVAHVESGGYRSRFGYILVDEFQDISPGRARPLKALPDRSLTAGLFAVSDDWQAVYRLVGSDIAIMREFEERFGESARIDLETPLRCADRSATVATIFVLSDPVQLRENVSSTRRADGPCVPIGPPSEECTDLPRDARAIRGCPCLPRKHPGTKRLRRRRDNRLTPRERTVGHRQLLAFGEA